MYEITKVFHVAVVHPRTICSVFKHSLRKVQEAPGVFYLLDYKSATARVDIITLYNQN